MKYRAMSFTLLLCTFLFSQSDRTDLSVSTFDDVEPGMTMKDVAQALRKHGYEVKETPGMLTVNKDDKLIGWASRKIESEGTVGSITYPFEALDFAVALHNAAQLGGTVVESPPWQHETSGQMQVRVIDSSDENGQRQFIDMFPSKSEGMYRIIIRRPNHAEPTVDFEFVR